MKSRQLLIDAHNLMHKHPEIKKTLVRDHLEAMRELCRVVSAWCTSQNRKATVVFDGVPQLIPGTYAKLKIRFSRERTADEVIISLLSAAGASRLWTVVTDDSEIRRKAFFYSVDLLRCDPFIGQLRQLLSPTAAAVQKPTVRKPQKLNNAQVRDPGEVANPKGMDDEVDLFLRLFKEKK
ncbi:MAG: NYN domain-containing protein [Candidatus Cyclonatronum sp.]|uniref:NYN domain-containing protein n=1 Tax=Cyclonatronum sp. TaxID=3024185 RepID=UPI0025C5089E|nr:NYN domain-containing protein [Cyclonatronum sp.]MCC5933686.1 NYN domain-containing protein [Balneolales bacterium]MCH8486882.1 NYN domain-containing protein [Cyclonatronum sp.]